jgi:sodium-dependent dicarboxylate transporter 2/3/5
LANAAYVCAVNLNSLFLFSGPAAFLSTLLLPPPAGMSSEAWHAAGVTLWMAIWWISEAIPVAVTALLPLVLFPLTGILPLKTAAAEFGNEIVFLFLCGFFFGAAIERWDLHRRIALNMVTLLGNKPAGMILGFMTATAFLSMWISNTATAVMMTPVAMALGSRAGAGQTNFSKALILGVAYACSIGGLGTIIGTPTNGIFISHLKTHLQADVGFGQWMLFGVPLAVILTLCCWGLLLWLFPQAKGESSADQRALLQAEIEGLGPLNPPERRLLWLFGAVILAWVSGSLLWYDFLNPKGSDTLVALVGALLLFLVPAGAKDSPLLDWPTAQRIPWGILLFFGGGLALAEGFKKSGLAEWIGQSLTGLQFLPPVLVLFIVMLVVVALSEVASNIATASIMMPVLQSLAEALGADPVPMLLAAVLAASFGFGLPIATAPNAIAFASGFLKTKDMARAGFLLDLVAVLVLLCLVTWLVPLIV